jgi:hypothetical protein
VVQNNTSYEQTSVTFNSKVNKVLLTNDILCQAYDGAKIQQEGKNYPQKLKSDQRDQGKKSRVWFLLDMNGPSG